MILVMVTFRVTTVVPIAVLLIVIVCGALSFGSLMVDGWVVNAVSRPIAAHTMQVTVTTTGRIGRPYISAG